MRCYGCAEAGPRAGGVKVKRGYWGALSRELAIVTPVPCLYTHTDTWAWMCRNRRAEARFCAGVQDP